MATQYRIIPPLTVKDKSRFWAKVARSLPDQCWLWNSSVDRYGYGIFKIWDGKKKHKFLAHRIAYRIAIGPIPDGLCVCHSCDTPGCCNFQHLWVGTNADNNRDRMVKERSAKGAQNPATKLRPQEVCIIRCMYWLGKHSMKEIGQTFGVTKGNIGHIIYRRTWKHIA